MLSPTPVVLVTCGNMEKMNIFTVGWTGIINTIPPRTYVSVRPSRYSHGLITETGEFVINLTTAELIRAADICGVHSGRDKDKFKLCGLTSEQSETVSAPSIAESPVTLECKVFDRISLGSHDMFLAEVAGVTVDDKYMDEKGKFHLNDAGLVAYSHGEYFELGKKIGKFGYSVQRPARKRKKR